MLTYEPLKNCAGIALFGDYLSLRRVHEIVHDVVLAGHGREHRAHPLRLGRPCHLLEAKIRRALGLDHGTPHRPGLIVADYDLGAAEALGAADVLGAPEVSAARQRSRYRAQLEF